jgi:hypothetical protein
MRTSSLRLKDCTGMAESRKHRERNKFEGEPAILSIERRDSFWLGSGFPQAAGVSD